jgi:hypothetical protein
LRAAEITDQSGVEVGAAERTVVLQHLDDVANLHNARDAGITVRGSTTCRSRRAMAFIVLGRAVMHEPRDDIAPHRAASRRIAAWVGPKLGFFTEVHARFVDEESARHHVQIGSAVRSPI